MKKLVFSALISAFIISCNTSHRVINTTPNDALVTYFKSTIEQPTLINPPTTYYSKKILAGDIQKVRTILWALWKQANENRLATWPAVGANSKKDSLLWLLPTNKRALILVQKKGIKPNNGYPMFINLHGGGTAPEVKSEWAAGFNGEEWKAAKYLANRYPDSPSLYFVPRMADDRRGRWYHTGEQTEFIRAWQLAVLSGDADPNKIYIEGISEGGYGSFRMGPFFGDYFAGAGPMAGVSNINEAPIENMRNTPFIISVGEFDYSFGRAAGGHEWKKHLDSISAINPGQFVHLVDIQKGKGHGIDYFKTAPWLKQFTRNPYPDTISFQYYAVHDTVFSKTNDTSFTYRKGFAYIRLDGLSQPSKKFADGLLQTGVRYFYVTKNENTYRIFSENRIDTITGNIDLYLDKIDFSKPAMVYFNNKLVYNKRATPNIGVMAESIALFGDPYRIFAAKINIPVN